MKIIVDELPASAKECRYAMHSYEENKEGICVSVYDCRFDHPWIDNCPGPKDCLYFIAIKDALNHR